MFLQAQPMNGAALLSNSPYHCPVSALCVGKQNMQGTRPAAQTRGIVHPPVARFILGFKWLQTGVPELCPDSISFRMGDFGSATDYRYLDTMTGRSR